MSRLRQLEEQLRATGYRLLSYSSNGSYRCEPIPREPGPTHVDNYLKGYGNYDH